MIEREPVTERELFKIKTRSKKELLQPDLMKDALEKLLPRDIAEGYSIVFRGFARSLTEGGDWSWIDDKKDGLRFFFRGESGYLAIEIFKVGFTVRSSNWPSYESEFPLAAPIFPAKGKNLFILRSSKSSNIFVDRKVDFSGGRRGYVPVVRSIFEGEIKKTQPS